MNVPAVASCHRRHQERHMGRGDTPRTHSTPGAAAGALPQTPSRVAASLGTALARSVPAYLALLAAAPGRLTMTLARGGALSRPRPPLTLRVPRWGAGVPPPPSAAALTETSRSRALPGREPAGASRTEQEAWTRHPRDDGYEEMLFRRRRREEDASGEGARGA